MSRDHVVLKFVTLITAATALVLSSHASRADELRTIGVLAPQNLGQATARWTPLAQFLSETIEGQKFEIRAYDLKTLTAAVEQKEVDLLLTDPGSYLEMETEFSFSRLLTLETNHQNHGHNMYGAVIFTRKDRDDIQTLADLREKSFGIVSPSAFDGFQMAYGELKAAGIDPFSEFQSLWNFGSEQDRIVKAVRNKIIDAGTVRTGVIEELMESGLIKPDELKVLNTQSSPSDFDLLLSTRLYPEWSLSVLGKTPKELAKRVARALLNLPMDHPAAISANIHGWVTPIDDDAVHDLFRALQVGPYRVKPSTIYDTLEAYQTELVFALIVFSTLLFTTGFVSRANLRLRNSQKELDVYRHNLERKVYQRTDALSRTNRALKFDINQRRDVERRLQRSRGALQSLYVISVSHSKTHEERIQDLLQLGKQHLKCDAALLFNDGDAKPLVSEIDDQNPPPDHISESIKSLTIDLSPTDGSLIEKTIDDDYRIILVPIAPFRNSIFFIVFAGVPEALEDEDSEIIHLMSEFVSTEIVEQTIEDENARHVTQLSHVTRVSTLNEMTSGLAHEINQPLTQALNYVNGTLRRLRSDSSDPKKIEEGLLQVSSSIERATEIIQNLRNLLRAGAPEKTVFDVGKAVRNVANLCVAEIRQKNIKLDIPENPPQSLVAADRIQIEQVILNLLRNAIDAVEKGGMIRITVVPTTDRVAVRFEDDGGGFQAEDPEKLFEPFYSTKGSGMGLGLSICRNIARAHSGNIMAANSGKGALFTLDLPLITEKENEQ